MAISATRPAPEHSSEDRLVSGPEPAEALLAELVRRRDLVFVTGKGGTGKSTLVATLAYLAARRRGGALAVELSAHPRLPPMIASGFGVEIANIDVEEAVGRSLGRLLGIPALASLVGRNRIIRQFIRTSPAVREMVALDELCALVEQSTRRGAPVIVDLPATGHAISFLDTPRAVRRMLRVGPLAQVAERVERLLLDRSRCELVAVALPEELPINETIELMGRAARIGIESRTVVVNRVPSMPLVSDDRALLDILRREADGALGRFASTARLDMSEHDAASAQIARLRAAVGVPIVELPQCASADSRACVETLVRVLSA
jgi:anion-transporting  ArsA/GET3 family ATPase